MELDTYNNLISFGQAARKYLTNNAVKIDTYFASAVGSACSKYCPINDTDVPAATIRFMTSLAANLPLRSAAITGLIALL